MPRSRRQVQPRSQRPHSQLHSPRASTPRPRPGKDKARDKGRDRVKVRVKVRDKDKDRDRVRGKVRARDKGSRAREAGKARPAQADKSPAHNSRRSSDGTRL